MVVRLNWANRVIGDSLKVYRDTAPFNFAGRPTALATIGSTDTEYNDSTAAAETTYFFALGVVSGANEAMGGLVQITTAQAGNISLIEASTLISPLTTIEAP